MRTVSIITAALILFPLHASGQNGAERSVTVAPGDVVRIEIWREEDLSGEFLVEEDGVVTLPLLGPQQVGGVSADVVKERLLAGYRNELRNPSIVITPLRRVYVLGEVNEPGLQLVDPTMSLAGAIALAGGANPNGDLRNIRVVRQGRVVLDKIPAERGLALVDVRSGDEIFVGRRGWFDRNSTFVVSALLSVTSLLVSLLR